MEEAKALVAAGDAPETVINEHLIPAINEVGELSIGRNISCRS